jgi:hypothetical protein
MSRVTDDHLARRRRRTQHRGMLNALDVAWAEEESLRAYDEHGLDPEKPPAIGVLCKKLFGSAPVPIPGLPREAVMGILEGEVRIHYRAGMWSARARFCVAHEAGHGRMRFHHGTGDLRLEALADLLGACLIAPRPAFERMVRKCGHSVYDLAHAFSTTQAAAMLRLGEVTGRAVRLLGPRERIRGEPFEWPDVRKCLRGGCRKIAHPVKLEDERKWGLMAS